jgi:hypothetical protein
VALPDSTFKFVLRAVRLVASSFAALGGFLVGWRRIRPMRCGGGACSQILLTENDSRSPWGWGTRDAGEGSIQDLSKTGESAEHKSRARAAFLALAPVGARKAVRELRSLI